jgi:Ca2+-transporting ATPase
MAILPNELPAVLAIFLALGAWRLSQKRVLTRRTPAIEALGAATVLCVDKTGTLTHNRMSVKRLWVAGAEHDLVDRRGEAIPEHFHEILEFGVLAGEQDPRDPMEQAVVQTASAHLANTEHLHPDWRLKRQYPLSPDLLALSQVWESEIGQHYPVATKGAPEAIVDLCHLSDVARDDIFKQVDLMAHDGLRVLGVAKSTYQKHKLPDKQHDFDFQFVGLVGLQDPIRAEVPQAIAECHAAGIRVIMITGDHLETAKSIAKQINLPDPEALITGEELDRLSDSELMVRVKNVNVCARMVPRQKLRLITALKDAGEIVAMTGDGVNDAPALKSAHIGIAMGKRGTDVARESAALVLLDDDFGSIVEAIKIGRRIYENLQHAMTYLLAVHIPITGISVIPVFFKLPLVLLPIHVAFLHLIIEPACSIAFEAESASKGIMLRPPRKMGENLFSRSLMAPTLFQGFTVLTALIAVFLIALYRDQGEADARTMAFTTLIIANLGLIITNRSATSIFERADTKNRPFWWILGGSLLMLTAVLTSPSLRDLFRFSQLHMIDIAFCAAAGIGSSLCFELLRVVRDRRTRQGPYQTKPAAFTTRS